MPAKLSRYYRERIITLWNGGANVSVIVRIFAMREEILLMLQFNCHVVYAILLLLLKTYIPAPIPAVLSPFSLLVSSFVEGSIQADLLLLCDSIANFLDNFASNSKLRKPKDVLHIQSLSFPTIVSSFKPTTISFAFLGILALSLRTITHAAIYIIIRDIVLMCVYFLHARVLWCSLPACVSHSCLWFRTFNHHNTPCTQTHLGTQDTQHVGSAHTSGM